MKTSASSVLVVGAGPVGLMLASELCRHGVRPRIIDQMTTPSPFCRAIGVTSRTLEIWEDMGIAREMIDAGVWFEGMRSIVNGVTSDIEIDLSDLPYSTLGLPQNETERILSEHLAKCGVDIERGTALQRLVQEEDHVHVELIQEDGSSESASFRYVIGCDGAHSAVRRSLGISFDGDAFPFEFMLGDVRIDWEVPRGIVLRVVQTAEDGPPELFFAVPLPEANRYRVSMKATPDLSDPAHGTEHGIQSERPAPGIEHLRAVADRMLPFKATLRDLRWSSIFRISMRLAGKYRVGNVFIAGDAAHIHPPTGGQGMNTGIQDAYNLAWKMALVHQGTAPESLLDSYEAERRPVGEETVARTTSASVRIGREESENARLADTQILVHYRGSDWVAPARPESDDRLQPGDRVPDIQGLRRVGVGHAVRLFEILRGTEHVLLAYCPGPNPRASLVDFAAMADSLPPGGTIRLVGLMEAAARPMSVPQLPVYVDDAGSFRQTFGSELKALLVRPDGYLAWQGDHWHDEGLKAVLKKTFLGT